MNQCLIGFLAIGPSEMIAILVVGLLVFGKRLPEVGRSLGKTFIRFRREISSIEEDMVGNVVGEPTENEEE